MTDSLDPAGDQWEIRQLVERYANAVDRADGEGAAALFTDDGELEVWLDPTSAESSGLRRGSAQIAAAINRIGDYDATQHVIANSVADIEGDHATGTTHCTAHHLGSTDSGDRDRVLYLRYVDTFARVDARWRLRRRELRVQWVDDHQPGGA